MSLTCRWPCRERDQNSDKRFIISTIKRRIISRKIYSHQVLLSSVFHPACWNPNYLECLFVFFLSWPKPLVFKSCVALWRTNSLCPLFKCTKVQEWKQADWPLCFKQSLEFHQLFFSSKCCFPRNHDMCCCSKKFLSLPSVAYFFLIFFILIFRDKHCGSYYLRVSEVW